MKNFLLIIIAFIASLTVQAQAYQLDNLNYSNICVVQQHIDVEVTIQSTFQNIYITSVPASAYYMPSATTIAITNNPISYYTSYTEQYRRGVGLITTNASYNTIRTINLVNDVDYSQNNYQNVQKYYCK